MPFARHIARHDDLALRFKLPLNGGLCDAQGHYHLIRVLRKLPQHRADVHRGVFAPVLLAVFHILQCYHPRNDDPPLLDVGRVIRADLHRLPQVAMPVMRVVEDAVVDERVARQKQQRRVESLHRVDIIGMHGMRLGYHRKQVGRVIAQNLVRRVRSEANGESLLIYVVAILEHLTRKLVGSLPVCELHLVPDNVLHLPQRGSRNDRLCGRVPMHPPQDDSRRSPVLPRTVAAHNRYAPRLRVHRPQNILLLAVRLFPKRIFHELQCRHASELAGRLHIIPVFPMLAKPVVLPVAQPVKIAYVSVVRQWSNSDLADSRIR